MRDINIDKATYFLKLNYTKANLNSQIKSLSAFKTLKPTKAFSYQ
jgi:hypothetical protein